MLTGAGICRRYSVGVVGVEFPAAVQSRARGRRSKASASGSWTPQARAAVLGDAPDHTEKILRRLAVTERRRNSETSVALVLCSNSGNAAVLY